MRYRGNCSLSTSSWPGRHLHERVISTCPLVFVATGLIFGILLQNEINVTVLLWCGLLALLGLMAIVCFSIPRFGSSTRYLTAYLALGCFMCLGAIRLTHYTMPEPGDIRNFVSHDRRLATIRGSILTEPAISRYTDWAFARFVPTDPVSSFYLNATEIKTTRSWEKVVGVVRVQVGEPVLDLKVGDTIQAYCWLDRFAPATNPGQFDMAGYMARRNVLVTASIQSRAGITLLHHLPFNALARLKARIRQGATNALLGDLPQDQNRRGLLEALLLGVRRQIDRNTYRAFSQNGPAAPNQSVRDAFRYLGGDHLGTLQDGGTDKTGAGGHLCRRGRCFFAHRPAAGADDPSGDYLLGVLRIHSIRPARQSHQHAILSRDYSAAS